MAKKWTLAAQQLPPKSEKFIRFNKQRSETLLITAIATPKHNSKESVEVTLEKAYYDHQRQQWYIQGPYNCWQWWEANNESLNYTYVVYWCYVPEFNGEMKNMIKKQNIPIV